MSKPTFGWFKIYRSVLFKDHLWLMHDDQVCLAVYIYLIGNAFWEEQNVDIWGQQFRIRPGEFPTSYRDIAKSLNLTRPLLTRKLTKLVAKKLIKIRSHKMGIIIKIIDENEPSKTDDKSDKEDDSDFKKIWGTYIQQYQSRYKQMPPLSSSDFIVSQIKELKEKVGGTENAISVIKFFFRINLKNRHLLKFCVANAEQLHNEFGKLKNRKQKTGEIENFISKPKKYSDEEIEQIFINGRDQFQTIINSVHDADKAAILKDKYDKRDESLIEFLIN